MFPFRHTLLCLIASIALVVGCSTTKYVSVRPVAQNPLSDMLSLSSYSGPKPSDRTQQYLRRYDLTTAAEGDAKEALKQLHTILQKDPSPDGCQAFAELSYIGGIKAQSNDPKAALDLFGASVTHGYLYLFDPRFRDFRNPYDPQFRAACELYNQSLESALRLVAKKAPLKPGLNATIELADQTWDVTIETRSSPWPADEIEKLEFVSDFEVTGLANVYNTYGLGVPMIAVRKKVEKNKIEQYHPPQLSFPLTAFLRLLPDETGSAKHQAPQAGTTCKRHRAVLELHDPLEAKGIVVGDRLVPLETDITTPLAYYLSNPELEKSNDGTIGLLNPEKATNITGLYMMGPYQKDKIPVVFVHGLWSSPMTWMEMYNDLLGDPELQKNYQFWFYFYPTGQPFWYSAAKMRKDLNRMRADFDPEHRAPALDKMVLVGHSMGGLVAKLQTLNSRDDFWHIVSDKPFSELKGDEELKTVTQDIFYFESNPSVAQVITLGTPHRGSDFANDYTQWIGRRLINLPTMLVENKAELLKENPNLFNHSELLSISTSIDSLSPKSPLWTTMLAAQKAPWTQYHNVVGRLPRSGFYKIVSDGDGIVEFSSAHLDDVASETVVPADHSSVHRHPASVMQVRKLLKGHSDQIFKQPLPTDLNGQQQAGKPKPNQMPTSAPNYGIDYRPYTGSPQNDPSWNNIPLFTPPANSGNVVSSAGKNVSPPINNQVVPVSTQIPNTAVVPAIDQTRNELRTSSNAPLRSPSSQGGPSSPANPIRESSTEGSTMKQTSAVTPLADNPPAMPVWR